MTQALRNSYAIQATGRGDRLGICRSLILLTVTKPTILLTGWSFPETRFFRHELTKVRFGDNRIPPGYFVADPNAWVNGAVDYDMIAFVWYDKPDHS
jgi:hypothetical protein